MLAEKSSTAIALGDTSARVRDYVDLYTLTGRQAVSYESVRAALEATTSHRGVELQPLSAVLDEFVSLRETAYHAFRRRLGTDGVHLPDSFGDVVAAVVEFVDRPPGSVESGRPEVDVTVHVHVGYTGATSV